MNSIRPAIFSFDALETCPALVQLRVHFSGKFSQVIRDALSHVAHGRRRPEALV